VSRRPTRLGLRNAAASPPCGCTRHSVSPGAPPLSWRRFKSRLRVPLVDFHRLCSATSPRGAVGTSTCAAPGRRAAVGSSAAGGAAYSMPKLWAAAIGADWAVAGCGNTSAAKPTPPHIPGAALALRNGY
jgi:hypothetical protein